MKPRLSLAAEMDLAAAMAYYVGAKKSVLPFLSWPGSIPGSSPRTGSGHPAPKDAFFFLDHRLKAGDDIVDATALCGLKAKFTFH